MTTLGIWSDKAPGHTTADLEAKVGRKFSGYRFNKDFASGFPGNSERAAYDAGAQPFKVYRAADGTTSAGAPIPWSEWPSGQHDSSLEGLLAGIKAEERFTLATPYLFAFHHEVSVQHQPAPESIATFKAAFRHISAYLRARIDARLQIVWDDVLRGITKGTWDPDLDQAGARVGSYYDILGLDCYQQPQSGHLKRTVTQVTTAVHARSKAAGIPWGWFEFGVGEGAPGEKAEFYSQMVPVLSAFGTSGPGSCMGVYVSNVGLIVGKQLYYPDTAPDSLAAFSAMANDPWFA